MSQKPVQTITPEAQAMGAWLSRVARFCEANAGSCFRGWTAEKVCQYIAYCQLTGRLWSLTRGEQVLAVAFAWADWGEHIEARAEQGLPQFSWTKLHTVEGRPTGDALFIAEVMGTRAAVGRLLQSSLRANPAYGALHSAYTYRHGRLVRLSVETLERFCGRRS